MARDSVSDPLKKLQCELRGLNCSGDCKFAFDEPSSELPNVCTHKKSESNIKETAEFCKTLNKASCEK